MTDEQKQETDRDPVEKVLTEFDVKEDILEAFCARTKGLIEAILQDGNIRYQSVQTRVKSKKKLREKYLDPEKDYKQLEDVTDLAGLRIITYYEDEVDQVAQIIKREFDIDLENSVDKRATEPDRFGYSAINYVCRHLPKRTSDVEYKKFAGVRCEIQITSILRHAWSEIEHEWYDLKDAYPDNIKRRFYRIAALLELAESEFLDIRRKRTEYQRSVAVRVEAGVPDLPINAVSLRPFIEQEPIVDEIDKSLASMFGAELKVELTESMVEGRARSANYAGITKLQDLRDALTKHRTAITEFVRRCRQELPRGSPVRQVQIGISIPYLALFLTSIQGKDKILEFLAAQGLRTPAWELDRQVAIAREVASKYSS